MPRLWRNRACRTSMRSRQPNNVVHAFRGIVIHQIKGIVVTIAGHDIEVRFIQRHNRLDVEHLAVTLCQSVEIIRGPGDVTSPEFDNIRRKDHLRHLVFTPLDRILAVRCSCQTPGQHQE